MKKTYLVSDTPEWELVYPKIDLFIEYKNFNQKFFGITKSDNDDIIFLGGNINH